MNYTITSRDEILYALVHTADKIQSDKNRFNEIVEAAYLSNPWFTHEMTTYAWNSIKNHYLDEHALFEWAQAFVYRGNHQQRRIGLIPAGNIPFAGFHDLLCVLASGHTAMLKLSSKDSVLMKYFIEVLKEVNEAVSRQIIVVDKLTEMEAVIATGSNNAGRYFDYYFGKYPHIIRRNRNSIAILQGDESESEVEALMQDIFLYFGLGCRNVSKIYVPEGYDLSTILKASEIYSHFKHHNKYFNNFEYQRALLLINKVPHFTNDFFILREYPALSSPISVLHFEFYQQLNELTSFISSIAEDIQCVVTNIPIIHAIAPGKSQSPSLQDYADGINTMKFLESLA